MPDPTPPPLPARVDNTLFRRGLIHRVLVEADANASGADASRHATPAPRWAAVSGLESVPCRLVPKRDGDRDNDKKKGAHVDYDVLFGDPVPIGNCHRLLFTDRDGAVHTLAVRGEPRDEHLMGHHWVAQAVEYLA